MFCEGIILEILNQAAIKSYFLWLPVFYLYHGLGITLGYHRLLTHKALKVPNWLKYFIVSGGYFCLMGSPIVWVGVHRQHHQKSDLPGDPHSPREGFKHAL
jgi:stearoyl-CoA desaturase (Delta-9 desaturase)